MRNTGDDVEVIFVKSYRHKGTGKLMIAAHYGLEAFCFKIRKNKDKNKKK